MKFPASPSRIGWLQAFVIYSLIVKRRALATPLPYEPVSFSIPPAESTPLPEPPVDNTPDPPPPDDQSGNFTTWNPNYDTYTLYFHANCSNEQILDIRLEWTEAGLLTDALVKWVPGALYQNAMDLYMGTDSVKTNWFTTSPKREIQYISKNVMELHNGGFPLSNTEVFMYCNDSDAPAGYPSKCGKGWEAYAFSNPGFVWNLLSLVFCLKYYEDLHSLGERMQKLAATGSDAAKSDMYSYSDTKAEVLFHETLHWHPTISSGANEIHDHSASGNPVYGPDAVKKEAKAGNAESTMKIADAYSISALAIYTMRRFGLTDPPNTVANSPRGLDDAERVRWRDWRELPLTPPPPPHDLDDPKATPDPAVRKRNNMKPVLDPEIYGAIY